MCKYHPRHPGTTTFLSPLGIPFLDFRYLVQHYRRSRRFGTEISWKRPTPTLWRTRVSWPAIPSRLGLDGDDMEAGIDAGYIYNMYSYMKLYVYIYMIIYI